jgi:hypothetical protein
MQRVFGEYIADVTARRFPTQEHTIEMPDEEWQFLKQLIENGEKK